MHAVVFTVDMKRDWEGNVDEELGFVVKSTTELPGFVRGTWMTNGTSGLSVVLFESEEGAREVAANASMPADASVTMRSVEVYEVAAEA